MQFIALAGILNGRCGSSKPQSLARIELQKVDGLAHISIGLSPVLAYLECQPGHELELALANYVSRIQQQRNAHIRRCPAPWNEGVLRGGHRTCGMFGAGLLMNADNLRRPRRIDGNNFFRGLDALAADHEIVFARQAAAQLYSSAFSMARMFSGALKSVNGSLANTPLGVRG